MCGIVAILRRPAARPVPDGDEILEIVTNAARLFQDTASSPHGQTEQPQAASVGQPISADDLSAAADNLAVANSLLSGVAGLRCLLESPGVVASLRSCASTVSTALDALERRLDVDVKGGGPELERVNGILVAARDSLWSIVQDRLRAAESVGGFLASEAAPAVSSIAAVEAFLSIHQALSSLDRLEVRGRDSAGLHLLIDGHGLDPTNPVLADALEHRGLDETFGSGSVRLVDGVLSVVYKTAVEIGELGDNTAALRTAIAADRLLAVALQAETARVVVLGHTRWASVGIISEANAHPLNSELRDGSLPYVVAALNGDVDNYVELLTDADVVVNPLITTDSKAVPALVGLAMADGLDTVEAFRRTAVSCEGSVAIAACTAENPDRLLLALRGSGQGLYVGFAEDAYVVASEPTGVVEETSDYLRMDGEVTGNVDNPSSGRGQVVVLERRHAGSSDGVSRWAYDGTDLPVSAAEVVTASVTTRDIDRGGYPHFLLKEIAQASSSFHKTLRGRISDGSDLVHGTHIGVATHSSQARHGVDTESSEARHGGDTESSEARHGGDTESSEARHGGDTESSEARHGGDTESSEARHGGDTESSDSEDSGFHGTSGTGSSDKHGGHSGGPRVNLGADSLPETARAALRDGSVRRIIAMGQGTAAIAAESFAVSLQSLLRDAGVDGTLEVVALPATELSAFHLRPDMSDTIVVAVSQSGTTTDTNRTVDLVRARGATVIAVVNRRNSDLTERSDGVLYTSDGRDVEMSVASTKAFYSQVAAGCLLAVSLAEEVAGPRGAEARRSLLVALREMPKVLDTVLERRPGIAAVAQRLALSRRHWAVVGNGPNQIAAREVRIKLSELCYKSISNDVTEDKKHIDLSAEPLVIVCAAGLSGSVADDVAKEVAIFRAHRAAPIVVADDGETRFGAASVVLGVPEVDPRVAFLPATMVGHIFGYEAALAIDALARPLRLARAAIEAEAARPGAVSEEVLNTLRPTLQRHASEFLAGVGRGDYDGTLEASTAVRLTSVLRYALDLAPIDSYEMEHGRIGTPTAVLDDLTAALTRAVDELTRPVDAIRHQAKTVTVGISRSDQTLLEARLTQAVLAAGAPRDHLTYTSLKTLADLAPAVSEVLGHTRYRVVGLDTATVISQGGAALGITSRTATAPKLTGTKHMVASQRRVLVTRGGYDGRTVVLVPEVVAGVTVGITLLHVRLGDVLSVAAARGVLQGYRNRYSELCDAVTETESDFDESVLGRVAATELLTSPIAELARRWRSR